MGRKADDTYKEFKKIYLTHPKGKGNGKESFFTTLGLLKLNSLNSQMSTVNKAMEPKIGGL